MSPYSWSKRPHRNSAEVERFIQDYLSSTSYEGISGATPFQPVYKEALAVQQAYLRSILKDRLGSFIKNGSLISIGIAYHKSTIDCINQRVNNRIDYNTWNLYAGEYEVLNSILNEIAEKVAQEIDGIAIPATTSIPTYAVNHVSDYYPTTLSHRLVALKSGLGWRGKNSLIIHPKFSCAVRFTSVLTELPLVPGEEIDSMCGDCTACEEVCTFIKFRKSLPDYRENCRRYLSHLGRQGITAAVCGKCIQACFRHGLLKDNFESIGRNT